MKTLCGFLGWMVGMFLGFMFVNSIPILGFAFIAIGIPLGRYIGGIVDEGIKRAQYAREEERREEERKIQKKREALSLAHKYPEATKHYFKIHWGIIKNIISDDDITDDKINVLLWYKNIYEKDELTYRAAHKAKIEIEKKEQLRRHREKKETIRKSEEEQQNLLNILFDCVSGWKTHNFYSSIKHKWFIDYYPFYKYKNCATASIEADWHLVWNFKNDDRISAAEHFEALQKVIELTEDTLRNTFKNRVNKLTLVCLTASTVRGNKRRFEEFSRCVCNDLGMNNGFEHIRIIKDANLSKHDGGDGKTQKQYDKWFFKDKYIILFDDVRTSGASLEKEKSQLESFGAKVIGAITLAQTHS